MKYHYRLWCSDCLGSHCGCFDGDSELSEELFETPEDAQKAGDEMTNDIDPWYADVVDEEGKKIMVGQ